MVGIAFLLDYIELMRRAGSRDQATWGVLLEMAALKLPHTAQEVMPFAILFGTMLAFWRLTRSNELVAARAAGVSVWAFLAPAVLVALLVGMVAVTLFNPIASAMQASYEKLENRILRQAGDPTSLSNGALWLRQSDGGGRSSHPSRRETRRARLGAARCRLAFHRRPLAVHRADRGAIGQARARILGHRARAALPPGEPAEPFDPMRLATESDLAQDRGKPGLARDDVVLGIARFHPLLEQSGFSAQRHRLHFNVLLARPLLFCAMVLVAATFSLRMQRRGGAIALLMSGVAAGFLLYFLSDVVFALGLSAKIPVLLAAWTPAGVSMIFGVSMLLHLEDG